MQLGVAFEARPNALNAVRLTLASAVVVWHALLYSVGFDYHHPFWQLLRHVPVDGFFAISGFLIVRSWSRRPEPVSFLSSRAARLLPGLWLCLVVTAFVIAPLVDGARVTFAGQVEYVIGNAGVFVTRDAVGASMPADGWNLTLWTLWWELCCYVAVLALGRASWLRPRVLVGIAVVCWAWMAAATQGGYWLRVHSVFWGAAIPRFGLMFALGALAWLWRDQIPLSRRWAVVSAGLLAASVLTPNYHLLGAPALAYLVLWAGIELGRFPVLRLDTDVSYGVYLYGTPVMFGLLLAGLPDRLDILLPVAYCSVLVVAATSWFCVERPVLSRVRRRNHRSVAIAS